jgi:NAD(P)-dependent dehydrogenase (short-subunit alcohol dehydrogenase family)
MRLRNRHAWVVGASSGIGAELAVALARAGARVSLSARRRQALEDVVARITSAGGTAAAFPADVTRLPDLRAAFEAATAVHGHVDLLVYCAGDWTPTDVEDFRIEDVERQVDVNLLGLARAIAVVLPTMRERRSGAIVGIASVAGYRGLPRSAAYGATKAGEITFLESLRVDLQPFGVRVVTVAPGFVKTPLTARNDFPMPFIISAEDAAARIVVGLRRGRRYIEFPRRLGFVMQALRFFPVPVYDIVAGRLRRSGRR